MRNTRNDCRGFATVMAVVVLGLIGITIAGMMTRMTMQARRTSAESIRAQHEQIEIARAMGKDVRLPDELRSR